MYVSSKSPEIEIDARVDRNCAIWFAKDSFDPSTYLNGRRVAGESFLKGFLKHADVDECVALVNGPNGLDAFKDFVAETGVDTPVRGVFRHQSDAIHPVSSVFISTPNVQNQLWARGHFGHEKYSICGLTHTINTTAVMEGAFLTRAAPQKPWDAVICTSQAVKSAMLRMFERTDEYLVDRFGSSPPLPQLPVIPLGVDTEAFAHDDDKRKTLREQLGFTNKDVIFLTVARLAPALKFDPIPVFLALREAQRILGDKKRLHYMVCGYYPDEHSEKVFEDAANELLEEGRFHVFDGQIQDNVKSCFSAADVFLFPIDNFQESFGVALVEAMSAGLPVIASDWDGVKDTVSEDVGIRVPTMSTTSEQSAPEGQRYSQGLLSYAQYSTNTSAQIEINMPALIDAIVICADKKGLRSKFGNKGVRRAKSVYDWSVIIPQMQDLWQDLAEIRIHAGQVTSTVPFAPPPMDYMASFPSQAIDAAQDQFVIRETDYSVKEMFSLRRYANAKRSFENEDTLARVYDAVRALSPQAVSVESTAESLQFNPLTVGRCLVWLLKYGFLQRLET